MVLTDKIKNLSPDQIRNLVKAAHKNIPDMTKIAQDIIDKPFPLSLSQKRIWFHSQMISNPAAYNTPAAVKLSIDWELDREILEKTIHEIVLRHSILRTEFKVNNNGEPYQIIRSIDKINIGFIDLSSDPDKENKWESFAQQESQKTFDLERCPLFRFHACKLHSTEYVFLIIFHHLISDGWSSTLFFQEFGKIYGLLSQNISPSTQPLPPQYIDFVLSEQNRLNSAYFNDLLGFWKEHLKNTPPSCQFPSPPTVKKVERSWKGGQEALKIPHELSLSARNFSQHHRITLSATLLSVFKILLNRYLGQEDILIGLPWANRLQTSFQKSLGLFLNMIPLRSHIDERQPFSNFVQYIDILTKQNLAHGEVPFEKIVEEINPLRNPDKHPIFDIMFVHQNFPNAYKAPGIIHLEPIPVDLEIANFDFTFFVEEFDQDLLIKIKYSKDLYDADWIRNVLIHFRNLLLEALSTPDISISQLKMLSSVEINETHRIQKNIHSRNFCSLFYAQAMHTPNALAVKSPSICLTYQDLENRSNELARLLRKQGVKPEVKVGVLLERSPYFLVAILSIWKAGGAFIPLDSSYPIDRISTILNYSNSPLLISETSLEPICKKLDINKFMIDREKPELCDEYIKLTPEQTEDTRLAYIIHTSGSTGNPKGICIEHRNLSAYLEAIDHEFGSFDCQSFAFLSSFSADIGYTQLFYPLLHGKSVVILPKEVAIDPESCSAYFSTSPVDFLKLAPSQMRLLLNASNPRHLLPKKVLLLAGEATPVQLQKDIIQLSPQCHLSFSYGPSETTVGAMTHHWSALAEGFLGHPNTNTEIFILNKTMNFVPPGIIGEIYIGGLSLARGYLNNSSLTAQHFVPHPYSDKPGERLYKTGDLGRYLGGGQWQFCGRKDRQVKIRGHRIELREIEETMLLYPGIQAAFVDVQKVCEEAQLIGYAVCNNKADDFKSFLQKKLPSYMVPHPIYFLDKISLSPSGKFLIPSNQSITESTALKTSLAPRDSIELTLISIWESLLNTHPIGIDDDFFALGGHSFLALHLMHLIDKHFGQKLPLGIMYSCKTIEQLAERIRNNDDSLYHSSLVSLSSDQTGFPLYFVHPAGGQILCYREVAKSCQNFSIHGFQAPFLDQTSINRHTCIEQIAEDYLQHITSKCLIGGWSLGALIAFEMAIQYQKRFSEYPYLVLIDFSLPEPHSNLDDRQVFAKLIQQIEHYNDINLCIPSGDLQNQSPNNLATLVYRKMLHFRLLPKETSFEDFAAFFSLFKSHSKAIGNYFPRPYHGKTLLIQAQESPKNQGWEKYIDHLEIHTVPGNHFTIMRNENALRVGSIITDFVKR